MEDPQDRGRCIPQALLEAGVVDLHTLDLDTDLLAVLRDLEAPLAPGLPQTGLLTAQATHPPRGGRGQA